MKPVRLIAKGTTQKLCILINKIISSGHQLTLLELLEMYIELKNYIYEWGRVGARFLIDGEFTDKQRTEASIIHTIIN